MRVPMMTLTAFLALAGCNGGSRLGEVPPAPADTTNRMNLVLAEIGKIQITAADLKTNLEERRGEATVERYMQNPDIVHLGLASLVDQFVWAEMAHRDGLRLDHADRMKVLCLETQLLATRYVEEVLKPKARPSPAEIEAWYREHQEGYLAPARVGVRHILVSSEAEAAEIYEEVLKGADFEQLARDRTEDEGTRALGGALGYVERGKPTVGVGHDEAFEREVLPMETGDLKIVHSRLGWHVVKAERKEGGGAIPLEQVSKEISDGLLPQNLNKIYTIELTRARDQVEARFQSENFNRFVGVPSHSARLFQQASRQTNPMSKIQMFAQIAYDFPDAKEAPEALFRMSYTYVVEVKDKEEARIGLERLQEAFSKSPWRKAGDYLLEHLDDEDPKELGSPEDILKLVN